MRAVSSAVAIAALGCASRAPVDGAVDQAAGQAETMAAGTAAPPMLGAMGGGGPAGIAGALGPASPHAGSGAAGAAGAAPHPEPDIDPRPQPDASVPPDASAPGGSSTPDASTPPSAPKPAMTPATTPPPFPSPSTPAERTPSPDNPAECPEVAPADPFGPCAGLPVYLACSYGTYNCICDWIHWICIG